MSELNRSMLRDIFVSSYEAMRIRLTHRLGSEVLARETLHDTYVRLHHHGDIVVSHPRAYLLRMALNIASDNKRSEGRQARAADMEAVTVQIGDDAADCLRHLAGRQDLQLLEKALMELTPRRRQILLASRLYHRTLWQIAACLKISQRLVEMELKAAVAHCAERLGRPVVQRFGPRPGGRSIAAPEAFAGAE